jgi:hypothetical protein
VDLELEFVVVVKGVLDGRSPCDEDDMRAIGINYWRTHSIRIVE